MMWIIDRTEGSFAVCEYETNKTIQIPLCALPDGATEGDALSIEINPEATKVRKKKINELESSLFKD